MLTARASAAPLPCSKSASSLSVDAGKNALLALPHLRRGSGITAGMIVAGDVKRAMNHEA